MRVNNNMMAMNANRALGTNVVSQGKSLEKLSSGKRINRAADDAAGLSISEKMRGQIRGLAQASRNAQDGISFIQTAEGALDEVSSMLVRLKELTVQKTTETYDADDVANLESEMTNLGAEIVNIVTKTEFNGKQINAATLGITISDDDTAAQMDIGSVISNATCTTALTATTTTTTIVDTAIKDVNTARSALGAQQNRLESLSRNLDSTVENLQAAESRIRDTDMAKEMMTYTKNNILVQSATAMLAQANQVPQAVLKLLQ